MAEVIELWAYLRALCNGRTPRDAVRQATVSPEGEPGMLFKCKTCGRRYEYGAWYAKHKARCQARPARAKAQHICIACGGTWKTARGYERHRCEPEVRHVGL